MSNDNETPKLLPDSEWWSQLPEKIDDIPVIDVYRPPGLVQSTYLTHLKMRNAVRDDLEIVFLTWEQPYEIEFPPITEDDDETVRPE